MLGHTAGWLIRGYQILVRPLLPAACRFYPSCSEYARQVTMKYGVFFGGWLAVRRIARCHPFHPGGFDPPPPDPVQHRGRRG